MRRASTAVLVLAIAGCDTGTPTPVAEAPAHPEPSAAPVPAEGSADEPGAADGSSGDRGATPEGPSRQTGDAWRPCRGGEQELVRSWPVLVDGAVVTIGDRLDGGALSTAYEFLPEGGGFDGAWMCRAAGTDSEVTLRATYDGVAIGPRWAFRSLEPGPDGRPPEPVAANRAAEAVMGVWSGGPEPAADALAAVARCRASGGAWLTSGIFVLLEAHGDGLDPDTVGWMALPAETVGPDAGDYDAVLHWSVGEEHREARWRVAGEPPSCEAVDPVAARSAAFADGIPSDAGVNLLPSNARPDDQPYRERDGARRSQLYAAAEQRELRTIADWIAFHARRAPFQQGEWTTEAGSAPDAFVNVLRFATGDVVHNLTWTVDAVSGDVRPEGRLPRLARAVQPRRLPGVEAPEERPSAPTPDALDAVVRADGADVIACLRRADIETATFRWSVQWDGHVFGVRAEGDGVPRGLDHCLSEAASEWELPPFAGPAVETVTTVTVP